MHDLVISLWCREWRLRSGVGGGWFRCLVYPSDYAREVTEVGYHCLLYTNWLSAERPQKLALCRKTPGPLEQPGPSGVFFNDSLRVELLTVFLLSLQLHGQSSLCAVWNLRL